MKRLVAVAVALALSGAPASACTLMAAAGRAAGGKVVVAKTRDRRVRFQQIVQQTNPPRGFRYMGIANGDDGRVTSGINERGLVAVAATASSRSEKGMLAVGPLLGGSADIDGALAWIRSHRKKATWILLLADPRGLAIVESAPERLAVRRVADGVAVHTNHYELPELVPYNTRPPGKSSLARRERVATLIQDLGRRGAVTPESLMAICRDHGTGAGEYSICRHPEVHGKKGGTLSAAVYELVPGQAPKLWVAMGQPCTSAFVPLSFDRAVPRHIETDHAFRLNEVRRSVSAIGARAGADDDED